MSLIALGPPDLSIVRAMLSIMVRRFFYFFFPKGDSPRLPARRPNGGCSLASVFYSVLVLNFVVVVVGSLISLVGNTFKIRTII